MNETIQHLFLDCPSAKWVRCLFSMLLIWPSLDLLAICLVRGLVINIRTLSLWFGSVSLPFSRLFGNAGMI
jgi:hypothetical protein